MQSWASSTLDVYERHLKNLWALQTPSESPILVLREYLLALYRTQQTSSDMRQAISACRLLEEAEIADGFIPRSIWRVVRAKDKVAHLAARGWGSLSALATMAANAVADEELLVTALAIVAIACCNRIGEIASIRVQDVDQSGGSISFFDRKTRMRWIKRPVSSYIRRLLGFIRATALRLGRRPTQNLVKGGPAAIQSTMVRLLANSEHSHLRWHAWRRMGATMFIRNGTAMQELMSWGRWKSVTVTRRYIATWDDCPWEDTTLPRPTLQGQSPGDWRFESGSCTSRSFWPASVLSRHDTWESDGSDEPNPDAAEASVPEILPTLPPPPPLQDPLCSPNDPGLPVLPSLGIQGRGPEVERGGVPQWTRSGPRLSHPSKGLRDPGSPSDSQPVSLPLPGVHWRTGLGPLHPKPGRPPQGGGGCAPLSYRMTRHIDHDLSMCARGVAGAPSSGAKREG